MLMIPYSFGRLFSHQAPRQSPTDAPLSWLWLHNSVVRLTYTGNIIAATSFRVRIHNTQGWSMVTKTQSVPHQATGCFHNKKFLRCHRRCTGKLGKQAKLLLIVRIWCNLHCLWCGFWSWTADCWVRMSDVFANSPAILRLHLFDALRTLVN